VTLVEAKQDALERGLGVIRKNYETTAKRGKLKPEDVEKRMGLLTGTMQFEALADCDLVIEAVFENMDVKKEVFGKLDASSSRVRSSRPTRRDSTSTRSRARPSVLRRSSACTSSRPPT
jgi:3-hydroxyacyl-CoA dehydrogenase